jgi:hypothetical protein
VKESVAIPIDQIAKVEAWRFSGPKTALLVVGVGAVQYGRGRDLSPHLREYETAHASTAGMERRGGSDSGTYAGAFMPALARTDVDNLDVVRGQEAISGCASRGFRMRPSTRRNRLLSSIMIHQCTIAPDAGTVAPTPWGLLDIADRAPVDFLAASILPAGSRDDALCGSHMYPRAGHGTRPMTSRWPQRSNFRADRRGCDRKRVVSGRPTAPFTDRQSYLHGASTSSFMGRGDTGAWCRTSRGDPAAQGGASRTRSPREMFLQVAYGTGRSGGGQGAVPGRRRGAIEIGRWCGWTLAMFIVSCEGDTVRLFDSRGPLPSLWRIGRVALGRGTGRAMRSCP